MQKTKSNISFRKASRADADDIFRIVASGFQLREGTSGWQHKRDAAYGIPESFLLMEKDNKAIGTLHIHHHLLRVGSTIITQGDVGEVAVINELQGQGFGTMMIQECVRYLRETGYHLSRLGGLNRFYAKFGYVPFPRRFYEFLLTDVKAGASTFPPEELVSVSSEKENKVRLYYPKIDWLRRNELYDSFNKNRSGSLVEERGENRPSGEPNPDALRFVYEENGEVSGYIFASEYLDEPSPFEAKVIIHDIAFDLNKPQAFTTLIRYTLRESLRRGVQRITARLPFDPIIQSLLTDDSLRFSPHEMQSGIASNMMLVANLRSLIEVIIPELNRRYEELPSFSPFSLLLEVDNQDVCIDISKSSISIANKADKQIKCDATAFLRWIIGLNGFDEWQVNVKHNLDVEQKLVMSKLFRREPCASGPWG